MSPLFVVALLVAGSVGFRVIAPRLKDVRAAIKPSPAPAPFSVSGSMALELGGFIWSSDADVCSGKGGYDDIHGGAQVVITDAANTTIAIGALEPGIPTRDPGRPGYATECRFPFSIADVPGGHEFYGVEISHRGKLQYTREQMASPLEFSLG